MLFSRAVLTGCLAGLKWLLWLVAALVLALIGAKMLRQEAFDLRPLLGVAASCAIGGFISGRLARWIEKMH